MTDNKDPQVWKKGDPPLDIGWEDDPDGKPRELSPDEKDLHAENMVRLNRIMRAYGILKIGVTALIIVLFYRFFGR